MNNDQRIIDQFLISHREIAIAAIEALEIQEIALLIESMAPSKSEVILTNIAPFKAGKVLERVPVDHAATIIGLLPTDVSESMLRIIDRSFRKQILAELQPDLRKQLKRALTFSKNQVGAHLEPGVVTVSESSTVEKVLSTIKTSNEAALPVIFVLDKAKTLIGYIETNDLLLSEPQRLIRSVMKPVSHWVFANMSVKDVLNNWDDSFLYLPVVKGEGQFVGVVSRSTLTKLELTKANTDKLALKAGGALGDLYLIGLTSLLGSSDQNINP
jgi:Mg/Co/Ni transporter MgtE